MSVSLFVPSTDDSVTNAVPVPGDETTTSDKGSRRPAAEFDSKSSVTNYTTRIGKKLFKSMLVSIAAPYNESEFTIMDSIVFSNHKTYQDFNILILSKFQSNQNILKQAISIIF
jgi:hypothetical protein